MTDQPKEFRNERLGVPTPPAPQFIANDLVAYEPTPGRGFLYGHVVEKASEPNRYIVKFDDRTRAINADRLTLVQP